MKASIFEEYALRYKMSRTEKDSLYSAQEKACEKFFQVTHPIKKIKKPDKLEYQKGKDGEVYDITGQSAIDVIATIKGIINDPSKWPSPKSSKGVKNPPSARKQPGKNTPNVSKTVKDFYFVINPENKGKDSCTMFKLRPNPLSMDQPANGVISIMYLKVIKDKGVKRQRYQSRRAKSYSALIKDLVQAHISPQTLATVIQKLFKDNSEIVQKHAAIAEMYFLLLFEIARRLSREKNKTEKGKRLDKLPIGSAIVGIIKQLSETNENLKEILQRHCNCFKGCASTREKSIIALSDKLPSNSKITVNFCVKELEGMYCKSKLNAPELVRQYYWTGSLEALKEFVKSSIQGCWSYKKGDGHTFRDEKRNMLMKCKFNKVEKRCWWLSFANHAKCITMKNELFKIVDHEDHKMLKFEEYVIWCSTFDSLERCVKESCKEWSKDKFESLITKFKYDEEKKNWRLNVRGVKEHKAVKEIFLPIGRIQFNEKYEVVDVKADGACFFRAVSHQMYGTEEDHHEIRRAGIKYIEDNRNEFESFLNKESVDEYIGRMSNHTEWCDHIIMEAVARAKKIVIRVVQPTSEDIVLGRTGQNLSDFFIGYLNGNHYVSLIRKEKKENKTNEGEPLDKLPKQLSETDEEMYCKSKPNAPELVRQYYWTGSLKALKEFVESIQVKGRWSYKKGDGHTLRDEKKNVLMNCKFNKVEKRWWLSFANHAKSITVKNELFKIVDREDHKMLKFEEYVI